MGEGVLWYCVFVSLDVFGWGVNDSFVIYYLLICMLYVVSVYM